MPSFLEGSLKRSIARSFKGRLKQGILQRGSSTEQDEFGDPVPGSSNTFRFEGFREHFDASWMVRAEIPETDVGIYVILGSTTVIPQQDDLIFIESKWHKVRRVLEIDPAGATSRLQAYEVPAP